MVRFETGLPDIDAQAAFARAQRRRRLAGFVAWLRGCRAAMYPCQLKDAVPPRALRGARDRGLQVISLESIVGSSEPSKARAFDRRFRPPSSSRRRWERLFADVRRGREFPPVAVYRVGDRHFVADGHHRISVASALGVECLDAHVTELVAVYRG